MTARAKLPAPLVPAEITRTEDGTPFSVVYDDIYYSRRGGLEETDHVFMRGNGLPERWHGRACFTILETGFGTGLNFLGTWRAWQTASRPCRLHFISAERHPIRLQELAGLLAPWSDLADLATALLAQYPPLLPGFHRLHFEGDQVTLTLLLGDAEDMLGRLRASVDAFYLDGFAPSQNPRMWSPGLFAQVARLSSPGTTLASFTVAGAVRRGLAEAGFRLSKRPGHGGKREMLTGIVDEPALAAAPDTVEKHALVIGAGIAGSACAERLAARGWSVDVIERHRGPAQEASGNHAGVLQPLVNIDGKPLARFTTAAFLYARRLLPTLDRATARWGATGVLRQARDERHLRQMSRAVTELGLPQDFVRIVDEAEASRLAGSPVAAPGLWFPQGCWAQPASLCSALLTRWPAKVRLLPSRHAISIDWCARRWHVRDASGARIASAPTLVLANAADASRMSQASWLPLVRVRGQTSLLPAHISRPLHAVVTREGYITPAVDGLHCFGASFDEQDLDPAMRLADHIGNLNRLEGLLPGFGADADAGQLDGRVGYRVRTHDRLPAVGALADASGKPQNLWCSVGLGSRGLVWAALAAEIVACGITSEPMPVDDDLLNALAPARYHPGP